MRLTETGEFLFDDAAPGLTETGLFDIGGGLLEDGGFLLEATQAFSEAVAVVIPVTVIGRDLAGLREVTTGAPLHALSFNGAPGTDYVRMGDVHDFAGTAPFTVECWVRFDSIATTYWPRIVSKETISGSRDGWLLYHDKDSGKIGFGRFVAGVGVERKTLAGIPLNETHHVAGVYDGTALFLYLDGVFQDSFADARSLPGNVHPLTVGAISEDGFSNLHGAVDDLRVWNTARTQAEILANMDAELNGDESGLVGYWKMNEGSGPQARDSTVNANHGTITGAAWVRDRSPMVSFAASIADRAIYPERLQVGPIVLTPSVLAGRLFVEQFGATLVVTPTVRGLLQAADRPLATVTVLPGGVTRALLTDRPQVGPVVLTPGVMAGLNFSHAVDVAIVLQAIAEEHRTFSDTGQASLLVIPTVGETLSMPERGTASLALSVAAQAVAAFSDRPQAGPISIVASSFDFMGGEAVYNETGRLVALTLLPNSRDTAAWKESPHTALVVLARAADSIVLVQPNYAFVHPEAAAYVTLSGGALKAVEMLNGTATDRVPVILEDGTVAYFDDSISIDAVFVEEDLKAILEADSFEGVRVVWHNEDDARLVSQAITGARLVGVGRSPDPEAVRLVFSARSLVKN